MEVPEESKHAGHAQKRQRVYAEDSNPLSSDNDPSNLEGDAPDLPSDDDQFAHEEGEDEGEDFADDWDLRQEMLQALMQAPLESNPDPLQQALYDQYENFINRHVQPSTADSPPGSDYYPFRSWTHFKLTAWALVSDVSARSFHLLCGILVDDEFAKADVLFQTLQALMECVDRLVPVATVYKVSSHTVVRRARRKLLNGRVVLYQPVTRPVTVRMHSIVDLVLSLVCDPECRARIYLGVGHTDLDTQPCQEFKDTPFARTPERWSRDLHRFSYQQREYKLGNLVKAQYSNAPGRLSTCIGRIDGIAYREGLWEVENARPGPDSDKAVAWPVLQVALRVFTKARRYRNHVELKESSRTLTVDVDELQDCLQGRVRPPSEDNADSYVCTLPRAYGEECAFSERFYDPVLPQHGPDVDFGWGMIYRDAFINQRNKSDEGVYFMLANTGRVYRHLACMRRKIAILPPGVAFTDIAPRINADLRRLQAGVPYIDPISGSARIFKCVLALQPADYPQLCKNCNHGGNQSTWNSPTSRLLKSERLDVDFDVDDALTDRNESLIEVAKTQVSSEWTSYLSGKGLTPSQVQTLPPKAQATCFNKLDTIRRRYALLTVTPGYQLVTPIDQCRTGFRDLEHLFEHGLLPSVHNHFHSLMVDTTTSDGSAIGAKTDVGKFHPSVREFRERVQLTPWPRGTKTFPVPWGTADRSPFGKTTTMEAYRQFTLASLHAYEGLIPAYEHEMLMDLWFIFVACVRPHTLVSAKILCDTTKQFIARVGPHFAMIFDCPNGQNLLSLVKRTLPALLDW
jgi:hypothetical protein